MPLLLETILHLFDWREVLGLIALYIIALLMFTAIFIPETMYAEKHNEHPWVQFTASLRSFFKSKQSILSSLLGGLAFGTYFLFVNVGSSMIIDVCLLPASSFAFIFAVSAVFQFSASVVNTRLVSQRGAQYVLRIAQASCILAVSMSLFWILKGTPSLTAVLLIVLCFTITHGLVLPNSIEDCGFCGFYSRRSSDRRGGVDRLSRV